jgi:tetrahydromethanopterin S-methyltransferase subunit D
MDQIGSWVSSLAAVLFGLLVWAMNYWSLSTVLLIVPALVAIVMVVGLFLQPPTSR